MTLLKKTTAAVALAAACTVPMQASATTTVEIVSAEITQLFSATFDGLVFGKSVADNDTFFGDVPDIANPVFGVNRTINITNTGGTGGGLITFDGTQLDELAITLPDLQLQIIDGPGPTIITVETEGASLSTEDIPHFDGGGDANFDFGTSLDDELPPNNVATFQTIDFSLFNNILGGDPGVVKSCTDSTGNCALLPSLSLDGVRYTLEGTLTATGGDSLTLRVQTSNTSYYEVALVTGGLAVPGKNVPVPAPFIYLTLAALAAVGVRLSRKAA